MHISEATKEALKGVYDTEPGDGGERDAYLERMGTKTYFIVEKVMQCNKIFHSTSSHPPS